jgi:hypothetical protein
MCVGVKLLCLVPVVKHGTSVAPARDDPIGALPELHGEHTLHASCCLYLSRLSLGSTALKCWPYVHPPALAGKKNTDSAHTLVDEPVRPVPAPRHPTNKAVLMVASSGKLGEIYDCATHQCESPSWLGVLCWNAWFL